jgi:hypothetical protein
MFNDKTPEESLKEAEEMQGTGAQEFDPRKNPEAISIIRQKDGNWKLWGQKFGKMIESRGVKPEDLIVEYITHE